MKKITLLLFCGTALFGFSQNSRGLRPANPNHLPSKPATEFSFDAEKTLLCQDTLRYTQAKEQILGNNTFNSLDIWEADNEGLSQTFLNSGSVILRGVEFFGMNNIDDGTPSVTVTASVYNVNAGFTPTTLITSGTVTFSSDLEAYHHVTFASPVTVTGNYAVVIQVTSADGIVTVYLNNSLAGQSYDELYARFKSSYYASSNGNWITVPAFTELGNFNFEALISPMVSYTLNAGFSAAPTTACLGTPVVFTNTTTPTAFLTNRMYNYQIFRTFFGTAPSDSTYVYDYDNSSAFAWSANTTYTYPAAGSYSVDMGVNGGFWNSCFDMATQTITINPIPTAPTITPGGATTFCTGNNVVLTSSAASGNTWSNGATTPSITVSASGNYTVTATALGCTSPSSASTAVTVNPLDNASFAYSSSTLCSGGGNETPTASVAGSYSSTAGLNFANATTGEIDMATSADGTYVITHTTSGACPNTSTQSVTITAAPDATFNYAQASYCTGNLDPSPAFGAGASGGTFSSTAGLTINSSNGQIDLSASTPGTYTVTNAIAASGSCPATSETFSVTVTAAPTPSFAPVNAICTGGTLTALPTTSTDGVMGSWSPALNNTATTTYTFTPDAGQCGTSTTLQIVVNPMVDPAFNAVGPFCAGDAISALPTTSTNNISGVWSPAINNTATTTYTFTATSAPGECNSNGSMTITVNPLPTVTLGAFNDLCIYNSAVALGGGSPAGGDYSGTGVSGGSFDPAAAGLGSTVVTYTYEDANGCENTATQNIFVDECLGLEEIASFDVTISPNPASEQFVIVSNGVDALTFTILSEDGKVVREPKTLVNGVSETISVHGFAKGIYFVRFESATQIATKKVIVN